MGISSIIGAVLKNVSWSKIATVAMEYAPELYLKAKERFQQEKRSAAETAAETELQERVARLEKLLLEQEGVIRDLVERHALLLKNSTVIEGRLLVFKIISGVLFIAATSMLILLLK